MHRPRGGAALTDKLPQAWVPRVVNLALVALLLLFLVPLLTHLDDVTTSSRVLLIVLAVPFTLLALTCLASAIRPGCLGRLAKRTRR